MLDAFAGEGYYDLQSSQAKLNQEYNNGVLSALKINNPGELLGEYLSVLKQYHAGESASLTQYPGSPALMSHFAREQDYVVAIENHPASFQALKENFKRQPRTSLHQRDAIEAIPALVPFKQRRGLVFVDPSYEVKTEYKKVADAVLAAYAKAPNLVYAIWYPILSERRHTDIIQKLKNSSVENMYLCEWHPFADATSGLLGSGMIIINKGWQLEQQFNKAFAQLNQEVYHQGKWFGRILKEK